MDERRRQATVDRPRALRGRAPWHVEEQRPVDHARARHRPKSDQVGEQRERRTFARELVRLAHLAVSEPERGVSELEWDGDPALWPVEARTFDKQRLGARRADDRRQEIK